MDFGGFVTSQLGFLIGHVNPRETVTTGGHSHKVPLHDVKVAVCIRHILHSFHRLLTDEGLINPDIQLCSVCRLYRDRDNVFH